MVNVRPLPGRDQVWELQVKPRLGDEDFATCVGMVMTVCGDVGSVSGNVALLIVSFAADVVEELLQGITICPDIV